MKLIMANLLFQLAILMVVTGLVTSQSTCRLPEDYSPCVCFEWPEGLYIGCFGVVMEDVYKVFRNRNTSMENYYRVRLNLNSTDSYIPADIMFSHKTSLLEINCPTPNLSALKVDQNAFTFSKFSLTSLEISNCDLSEFDFAFLTGFDSMTALSISFSSNLSDSFLTLPTLSKLTSLAIYNSPDLNELTDFPKLNNGLKTLQLSNNGINMNDSTSSRILEWVLSSSENTLENLQINDNQLTKIPDQIVKFRLLAHISLQNNVIPTIDNGSLLFSVPVKTLHFYQAEINNIAPGAFQGDFNQAETVSFMRNNLTRFEVSVFYNMLQQLHQSTKTVVSLDFNPFDCEGKVEDPCHLAWIIRDYPSLLESVSNAKCSNGTFFTALLPEAFNDCPETQLPPEPLTITTTIPSSNLIPFYFFNPGLLFGLCVIQSMALIRY